MLPFFIAYLNHILGKYAVLHYRAVTDLVKEIAQLLISRYNFFLPLIDRNRIVV